MPRRPFTRAQALANGITVDALRWGLNTGRWQSLGRGVFLKGGLPPTTLERALGLLVAVDGVASHSLAGELYELDGVVLRQPYVTVPPASRSRRNGLCKRDVLHHVVNGYPCAIALQTMIDLASVLDDLRWEQALECALRKRLVTIGEIEDALPDMGRGRMPGTSRVRRVLMLRPPGAPPTGSLLETLMVQLIRTDPSLPTPSRQVEVRNRWDEFVAWVDLAYPEYGVFIELDGQQHLDQPVYDATRQTAVAAAKRWMTTRFTWNDVNWQRRQTLRRLREILDVFPRANTA